MRFAVVAIAVLTMASCSIYGESFSTTASSPPDSGRGGADAGDGADTGSIDGSSNGTDSGGDANDSARDGAGDGGTKADAAPVPTNGDFEIPTCDGWLAGGNGTTVADETTAVHGGSHACKVCGSGTIWQLGKAGTIDATIGDAFASTAWVRAESGTVPISIGIEVDGALQNANIVSVGTTYTELQSPSVTASKNGPLNVRLDVSSGGTTCFIVDDAFITLVPN